MCGTTCVAAVTKSITPPKSDSAFSSKRATLAPVADALAGAAVEGSGECCASKLKCASRSAEHVRRI